MSTEQRLATGIPSMVMMSTSGSTKENVLFLFDLADALLFYKPRSSLILFEKQF